MYAEITIIFNSLDKTFIYSIPHNLTEIIQVGNAVHVEFGTALAYGVVVEIHTSLPDDFEEGVKLKPIQALLHPNPIVSEKQVELARWMAYKYLASLSASLSPLLPQGFFSGTRDILVTLLKPNASAQDMFEHRVLNVLQRRGVPLRGAQLSSALSGEKKINWEKTLARLEEDQVVRVDNIFLPPSPPVKQVETAQLLITNDEINKVAPNLGKSNRRADILENIISMELLGSHSKEIASKLSTSPGLLKKMAEAGLLHIDEESYVSLNFPVEQLDTKLIELREAENDIRILRVIGRETEPIDVSWVYTQTGAKLSDLKRLARLGLIHLGEFNLWYENLRQGQGVASHSPDLTQDQNTVVNKIIASIDKSEFKTFLLHGVTGSGKTEIYLNAIQHVLNKGKTAIFLVPEISLTPQTTTRVASRFLGQTVVFHSGMTPSERYDAWQRCRDGRAKVVVGARSAIFVPLPNIGIVILDEEHDNSYKQSPDQDGIVTKNGHRVYYQTHHVAEKLMQINSGVLVLGSATPDIETAHRAINDEIEYLKLPKRILAHREQVNVTRQEVGVGVNLDQEQGDVLSHDLPPVSVVDMRAELKAGNTSIFSAELHTAIQETLSRKEQVILFLNRRGKSTYVFCRDCGYVSMCPNCDTPLTYHHDGVMRCHRCAHHEEHPKSCPNCSSHRIKYFGAGTQQVENAVKKAFSSARVVRWDADTASDVTQHEIYLHHFMKGEADMMVGTQMIAKGLDLPRVTLVGIVSADTALYLPDFRAGERTFQLLTQVAGRAGRSLLGGRVILQTYQPQHYAVDTASRHDYHDFYQREIHYRRQMGYPPFRRMARILFRYPNAVEAQHHAEVAADRIRKRIQDLDMTGTELIGPAPCFFTKVAGFFRWHLLLRGPNPEEVLRGITFEKNWYVDIDPVDVL